MGCWQAVFLVRPAWLADSGCLMRCDAMHIPLRPFISTDDDRPCGTGGAPGAGFLGYGRTWFGHMPCDPAWFPSSPIMMLTCAKRRLAQRPHGSKESLPSWENLLLAYPC